MRWRLLGGVAIIGLASVGPPVSAQEQAATPAPSQTPQPVQAAAKDKPVDEIVVTAMRRPEILRKVPLSVTAISAKTLEERHITDVSQIVYAAPSLQVQSNNGSPVASFFSVRGIGTLAFVKNIEQSVGLDVDGVALVRPETGVLAFYDINDVEVLNGPQGMLFGKNASAGLINVTTKNPQIGQFSGYVSSEYGSMTTPGSGNEFLDQAVVNIPVTENSALRITGVFSHTDPFVKDVYTDQGEQYDHTEGGVRAKYLVQPNSDLSITFSGDYANSQGVGPGETTDRILAPGSPNAPLDKAVGVVPGPNNVFNSSDAETNDRFLSGGVQSNVAYTTPWDGTITNIAAWRGYQEHAVGDNDDHQTNVEDYSAGYADFSQVSDELRYTSPTGEKLEYQFGAYFLDARIYEHATIYADLGLPPPPPPYLGYVGANGIDREHLSSAAGFGQATYHITDRLRVLAGLRYTQDTIDNTGVTFPTPTFAAALPVGVIPKTVVNHNNISWRGSLQYDITPDVMGYVTIASGYKGPGFNQFSALPVAAETSYQYEAGIKTRLFGGRGSFNLAVYDEKFDHFQDQTYFPVAPYYAVLSAGSLDTRGFEASADARVTDKFTVSASIAYVDAFFDYFPGDQCYVGEAAGTAPSPNVCYQGHSNSTGNTLENAPKWAGTVSGAYVQPVLQNYQLELNGSVYFKSSVNFSSDNNPNTFEGGYALVGLNAVFGPQDGNWRLTIFCRNCADRRFATYIEPYPLVPADYGQQFGVDSFRTVGLSLRKSF
jgi:iron complex outermembrane recepter protein